MRLFIRGFWKLVISLGTTTTPPISTPEVLLEPQLSKGKILGDLINTYR